MVLLDQFLSAFAAPGPDLVPLEPYNPPLQPDDASAWQPRWQRNAASTGCISGESYAQGAGDSAHRS